MNNYINENEDELFEGEKRLIEQENPEYICNKTKMEKLKKQYIEHLKKKMETKIH